MVIKSSKSEEQEGYRGPGAPVEDLAPKIIWASSGNDILSFIRHKIHYGSVSTQILDNASEASNFEIRQYQEGRDILKMQVVDIPFNKIGCLLVNRIMPPKKQ